MENNYIVYLHVSPNDKKYYGITSIKPERRWQNGKAYKNNKHFTNAIKKYGWENFKHIIVAKGLDEETAKWLEVELIREWDSTNPSKGYNITKGGEGANGLTHSEETRKKISNACKGENHHFYGKKHTEGQKKKISVAMSGKNNHMYGKHHSEETRKKMSEARIGKCEGENHPKATSVICITTNRIFNTIKEGAKEYNIKGVNISQCCRGKAKSAGKYNGQKLVWKYIEIIEL